ncbi:MAG: GHMP kinase [Anaerolineaceae bacterium]|jgi:D-glycero-alpha-D-manno-heptose-7-phosphate kinase
MIIVQTPLRISLFGGGTDFPSFYQKEGGCVLTTAIDKYVFITIKKRFDKKLRIGYTRTEMVDSVDEINHELIRESMRKTGIHEGVEVTTIGDIPEAGSGLGSSSTVTVGALQAMYTYNSESVCAGQLAKEACEIEIETLGKPIGIQDQYIAAFGGMRMMEFQMDGNVTMKRLALDVCRLRSLNDSLLLFYTGMARKAAAVLEEQKNNIHERLSVLRQIKQMAYDASRELECGDMRVIGEMLHESWLLKKELASQISNDTIDSMYQAARKAGAIGGKITGAGGGGFLLLFCAHEYHDAVRKALSGLQELPFLLEPDGCKVIFNYRR